MFSSTKIKIALGIYIFLILSIPVGAYLASQAQTFKSSASQKKTPKVLPISTPSALPKETLSPIEELKLLSEQPEKKATSSSTESSPTFGVSFGPTLTFKLSLEGRPSGQQSAKIFVGIIEGSVTNKPKYLLSFTVDLPGTGDFANLSLAGLTPNNQYTVIIKGPAQIATSSAFLMSPTVTKLNEGAVVNLLSGDLNEDNTVNSTDYSISKAALGSRSTSANWNDHIDLNKDGVVNNIDLGIVLKNLGAVGATGIWSSTPSPATSSASLTPNHPSGQSGYWIWIPK